MDEFNNKQSANEFNPQVENKTFLENTPILENKPVLENETQQETQSPDATRKPRGKKEKKNKALSAMSGSLVAIIGAATVGITTMLNVKLNAEFESVDYNEGVISYKIKVTDLGEETLNLSYYAHEELVEVFPITVDNIENDYVTGTINVDMDDLQEKLASGHNVTVRYRLSLSANVGLDVERKFDSYVVKIDKVTSAFENVDGRCTCGIDGCYTFQMNFTDDLHIFSDFEAYMLYTDGSKSENCTFSEDLHGEQKIYLDENQTGGELHVFYTITHGEEITREEIILENIIF